MLTTYILINLIIWLITGLVFVALVYLIYKKVVKPKLVLIIISPVIIVICLISILISKLFISTETKDIQSEEDMVTEKLKLVEEAYLDYKDWEEQESFAGKTLTWKNQDDDYYFAYITNGSGVYIIKAECFKVDKDNQVSVIGEFPGENESTIDVKNIDPVTCRGIK